MLIFESRHEKRGGMHRRFEGRELVSCSRVPNYKGRETAARIPSSEGRVPRQICHVAA